MITKRIIPCLDVRDGRVVKGRQFENVRDVDLPVDLARRYTREGADELVFYDITATHEGRALFTDILAQKLRTSRLTRSEALKLGASSLESSAASSPLKQKDIKLPTFPNTVPRVWSSSWLKNWLARMRLRRYFLDSLRISSNVSVAKF